MSDNYPHELSKWLHTVADGNMPLVSRICNALAEFSGHQVRVLFTVLEKCPHDVIIGIDILSEHAGLVECSYGVLRLFLCWVDANSRTNFGVVAQAV